MKPKRWFLVSADFKPMRGGVAEFSFQIADTLKKKGILQAVMTPLNQPEPLGLPIISPSRLPNGRRYLKWFEYRFFYFTSIFTVLTNQDSIFFFSYIDELYALPLLRLCVRFNIEFIVLFHGKDILNLSDRKHELLDLIFLRSKQLVFNSLATAKLFERCTNRKVMERSCIWNPGGRFDHFDQLETHSLEVLENLPKNAILISSVCRLVKRKGIHFAVQAFNQLCSESEFQNVYYIIAGDGHEKESLEALASLNSARILFLGDITENQKKALLQRSNIFIMPNYSDHSTDFEGFGISFIEAAYFENIVIGGRSGGAVEAVSICPKGFLVDTDLEDPVPSIKKILSDSIRGLQKKSAARDEFLGPSVKKSLRERLNLETKLESYLRRA